MRRSKKILLYIILMFLPLSASAQLSKSALNYLFQKPKVVKTFDNKKIGDHLFLQIAMIPTMMVGNETSVFHSNYVGLKGGFMLGDWITPEHGIRLGFNTSYYNLDGEKLRLEMFSVDYLMNITALSEAKYKKPSKIEFHGVFGFDLMSSRQDNVTNYAIGGHIGLQSLYRVNNYFHVFIEPRFSVFQDKYMHLNTLRGYRSSTSLLVGVGYNLLTGDRRSHTIPPYKSWNEGWFFSYGAGGGTLLMSNDSNIDNFYSIKSAFSVGKYFTSSSAIRFSFGGQLFHLLKDDDVKIVSTQLDYLFNLSNAFAGYLPHNNFEINLLAGINLFYWENETKKNYIPGLGFGVQANYFLNKNHTLSFFVEPRFDIYRNDFLVSSGNISRYDLIGSIMVGLSFHNEKINTYTTEKNNNSFHHSFTDNAFVQGGLGLNINGVSNTLSYLNNSTHIKTFAGLGKWFSPNMGIRFFVESARHKNDTINSFSKIAAGADYLLNASNLIYGPNPNRRIEFIGSMGVNLLAYSGEKKLLLGANAGIQALFHINDLAGFYFEPQLRIYGKDFDNPIKENVLKATFSLVAGLQLNLNHLNRFRNYQAFKEKKNNTFLSVAGGIFMQPLYPNNDNYRGTMGRISYGYWYNSISAWRLSGSIFARQPSTYVIRGAISADYISDLTSRAFGYDKDRIINLRAVLGGDLALDYFREKTYLTPVIHIGAQLGVRLSPSSEIYLEPQLAVDAITHKIIATKTNLISERIFVGLNYALNKNVNKKVTYKKNYRRFVSGALGIGFNSLSVTNDNPFARKLTLTEDFSYGQWINNISGWSFGLNNETLQVQSIVRKDGSISHYHNKNIMSLQWSYLVNINSYLNGGHNTGNRLQMIAQVGLSENIKIQTGRSPTFAPGLLAAIKMDIRLSDKMSFYIQPKLNVISNHIQLPNSHFFEASNKIFFGTTYHFK